MPLDNTIYKDIRRFTLEDPAESEAKGLELQRVRKQARLETDLEEAARISGGDLGKTADELMRRGHASEALKVRSAAASQSKAARDEQAQMWHQLGSDAMALDATYRQILQQSGGNQQAAAEKMQPIARQTMARYAQLGVNAEGAWSPEQNMAAIGRAKEAVQYLNRINPSADARLSADTTRRGQDVTADTTRRGQDLTDSRTRAEGAANRAVTQRGQDMTDTRSRESGDQGRVPAGYRYNAEGNLEAIPGGPADLKVQGQFNQDTATLQSTTSSMDRLAGAANEALKHPGLRGITGVRGTLPNMPGSEAADAQAKLNTLKSQVAFGVLQEMRNNSKTGGALGNVSDAEGKRLEANLAALENAQSYSQMQESLRKIVEYADNAKDRIRTAYNLKHGERGTTKAPPAAPRPSAPAGQVKFLGFE